MSALIRPALKALLAVIGGNIRPNVQIRFALALCAGLASKQVAHRRLAENSNP